jgi:hypothetical protein
MEMKATYTAVAFYYVWTETESLMVKLYADMDFQEKVLVDTEFFVTSYVRKNAPPPKLQAGTNGKWLQLVKDSCKITIQEIWKVDKGDGWTVSRIHEGPHYKIAKEGFICKTFL